MENTSDLRSDPTPAAAPEATAAERGRCGSLDGAALMVLVVVLAALDAVLAGAVIGLLLISLDVL